MTNLKRNEQVTDLSEQVKSLVEKGNSRHIVIRHEDGSKIAEVNLTVAAIIGLFIFFMPFSWFVIAGAVIYGIVQKVRVEVIRDVIADESVDIDLED